MDQIALRGFAIALAVSAVVVACSSSGGGDASTASGGVDVPSNPPPPSQQVVGEAVIGAAGGSVGGEGVSLAIPPGALPSDQQIRVTKTSEAPPAGVVARSPVFRFEPAGLTFSVPARVTFTVASSSSSLAVHWSKSSGPGFDALPTVVQGTTVLADVTHFSLGFVAEPAATTVAPDASVDASDGSLGTDATTDAPTDATSPPPDANACGPCPNGLTCCGTTCRDLANDPSNCAKCGMACAVGEACKLGSCTVLPPGG